MKKLYTLLLVTMLLAIPVCGYSSTVGDPKEDSITIASGIVGSSWNVIASSLAGLIEEKLPGKSVTVIPGGGAPNIMGLGQKQVDLGISYNNIAWLGMEGKGPFQQVTKTNAIASFTSYALHVIIRTSAGVDSWDEIIEKKFPLRIGVGTRGATADLTLQTVLKEYGVSYDDFKKWGGSVEYLSYPDAISLIRDNRLDALAGFPDLPSSYIVESMEARPMKFLEIRDDVAQAVVDKAGYVKFAIPAGTYKEQNNPVNTLGANMILAARPDLSNEMAYHIAKILAENKSRLVAAVASMKNYNQETAWKNTGAPLHPGAEQFYKEIGVMK